MVYDAKNHSVYMHVWRLFLITVARYVIRLTSSSVAFSSLRSLSSLRISRPASSKSCSYLAWLPVSLIAEKGGFSQHRGTTSVTLRFSRGRTGRENTAWWHQGDESITSWPDTTKIVRYRFASSPLSSPRFSLYVSLSLLIWFTQFARENGNIVFLSYIAIRMKRNTERF